MVIPLIIGSSAGVTFIVISRLMAGPTQSVWFDSVLPASLVRGVFIGSVFGVLTALIAEPIAIDGFYQEKEVQQHLFSTSTVVLVKTKGVEKLVQVSGTVLGLEKGENVIVEGHEYLIPQVRDFDKVYKRLN